MVVENDKNCMNLGLQIWDNMGNIMLFIVRIYGLKREGGGEWFKRGF